MSCIFQPHTVCMTTRPTSRALFKAASTVGARLLVNRARNMRGACSPLGPRMRPPAVFDHFPGGAAEESSAGHTCTHFLVTLWHQHNHSAARSESNLLCSPHVAQSWPQPQWKLHSAVTQSVVCLHLCLHLCWCMSHCLLSIYPPVCMSAAPVCRAVPVRALSV